MLTDQHPKDLFRYRYNTFFLTLTFIVLCSGGYNGLLIQTRNLSVIGRMIETGLAHYNVKPKSWSNNTSFIGSILESDNSAVSTFGRKLPIQGFQKKNSVNLINLLTQLIMVCLYESHLKSLFPSFQMYGKEDFNGLRAGYFRARIRKDNFKLEVDVERMVEQNW